MFTFYSLRKGFPWLREMVQSRKHQNVGLRNVFREKIKRLNKKELYNLKFGIHTPSANLTESNSPNPVVTAVPIIRSFIFN